MSDNPGDDVRKYDRVAVPGNYQAILKDQQGHEQKASVTDISAGGAGLVVDGQFANN